MYVLIHWDSMDSTLADKVMKKMVLDLQKRFPIYHACPNIWRPIVAAWHSHKNGLAFRLDLEKMGRTQVDWERGIVHRVLIQHL